MKNDGICSWALRCPEEHHYHDNEWGVPLADDRKLFEFVVLEGAQAGLSWSTIIKRRDGYRKAFHQFDPARVARFGEPDVARLLEDTGIIRNRAKIRSAIRNAQAFVEIQREFGSFAAWIWNFIDGRPQQNSWKSMGEVPATTPLSDEISKALKARGFSFVGSTIVYAHMQATGMVNDHLLSCPRHAQIVSYAEAFTPPPTSTLPPAPSS